ncbi:MAG: type II secretion system GspH family protein [Proteobacteria bacterium]|nr:type II secretion system GspH family protein [Pseudomonadota bacterium]MBU1547130.1 type II secretion system GspH family protein [Pseudomonadota bacterium]MBU2620103.1 type II secretion system GspH family protein [Pseudomonadota bacterium]
MSARIFIKKPLRQNAGFTLVEIVITIVILGAVAGILVPFLNAIVHSPDPVIRERAISLGQAMMDEIMAKRWDENTPMGGGPLNTAESARGTVVPVPALGVDAGEDRTTYDDVDDYNSMPPEIDNFTDQNNNTFNLPGYRRQVTVRYIASTANPIDENTPAAAGTTDTKLVVVRITSPLGEIFNFVAVACNF